MMKLDLGPGEKPLWSQLYDILEQRIINGDYPVGDKMPPEMKLMEEFQVSRITVRQAMDKLIQSGFIVRKRGKGTIVLKRDDKVVTAFQSYFNGVYEKNNETDRRVLSFTKVIPPIEASYYFNLEENQETWCLVREIWVNKKPVARFETYLNPQIHFQVQDNMSGSLYQKLQSLGCEINHVVENITASLSNEEDQEIFHLSQIEAIVHRIRKGYSQDIPMEYTISRYVSSGYELTIDLK